MGVGAVGLLQQLDPVAQFDDLDLGVQAGADGVEERRP